MKKTAVLDHVGQQELSINPSTWDCEPWLVRNLLYTDKDSDEQNLSSSV